MRNVSQGYFRWMINACIIILSLGITSSISGQQAQDKIPEVEVILRNGQEFVGVLKEENDSLIILVVDEVGEITIEKSRIKSIKTITTRNIDLDAKGFPVDYHNSTRYLISPSGYGLKRGQAYYENIYVFFNSFAFGISDRFTITVGGEVASPLFAGEVPVMYISPRFNFALKNENGAFSAGAIFFTIPESDLEVVGLAQAALTLGNRNNNINLGFGVGFSSDESNSVFMFNLAASQRLTKKLSFVTDNFVFTEGGFGGDDNVYVLSAALRIHFSKPGAALNVGLWRPLEDLDDLIAIPMISATIPFSSK